MSLGPQRVLEYGSSDQGMRAANSGGSRPGLVPLTPVSGRLWGCLPP